MPSALVTGATGLVGSHVVERLGVERWSVRALVRDPAASRWLEEYGVDLSAGDVLDADTVRRAATGCEVIFHCAAEILPAHGGWEAYRATNVGGTRNVLDAAAAATARLLHVSSVAVYGGATRYRDRPTDERVELPPLPDDAHYARSKRESEELVLAAHASGRVWAAAVRPSVIYGKRDRQFVPRIARAMRFKIWPRIGGGRSRLAIVHAASVADGAFRAATSDAAAGRVYNVARDFDVTVEEFVRLAGVGLGVRIRMIPIPLMVARVGFKMLALMLRLTRGPHVSSQAGGTLAFLTRDNPFASELARRELGWSPPVPPAVGVPEAFAWWKHNRPTAVRS